MCGLSGYAGIRSHRVRMALVDALGDGIDSRGGHAAGYAAQRGAAAVPSVYRTLGRWGHAKPAFVNGAAQGSIVMMHARYATHGSNVATNAHPFTIRRKHHTIVGAHNGIVWDADDSAAKHGRSFTVDSREAFELLADDSAEELSSLSGYGAITWFDSRVDGMLLCKLTDDGAMVVHRVKGGGIVWGSTSTIVDLAIAFAGLSTETRYEVAPNVVHRVTADGSALYLTDQRLSLSDRVYRRSAATSGHTAAPSSRPYGWNRWADDDEEWAMWLGQWRAEERAKRARLAKDGADSVTLPATCKAAR